MKQVVSTERKNTFGEVYTNEKEVCLMCDLIKDKILDLHKTILEPCVGKGAFIFEVVKRRLEICKSEEDKILAISTLYGIDIQKDNVEYVRNKLYKTFPKDIVDKNFVWGNSLTFENFETHSEIDW